MESPETRVMRREEGIELRPQHRLGDLDGAGRHVQRLRARNHGKVRTALDGAGKIDAPAAYIDRYNRQLALDPCRSSLTGGTAMTTSATPGDGALLEGDTMKRAA